MKPKKRQKLCSNCDGEIDLDVIVCPYCAADLREEKPEQQRSQILQGSVRPHGCNYASSDPAPLPPEVEQEKVTPLSEVHPAETASDTPSQKMAGTVVLLTFGIQLMILGFLLVFLSDNGSLTLKWDARLWFLYIFASVPFLVFGYRLLSKL